ncbi:hypothetical protein HK104_008915, partial [Borealophlyctis nickersoniae]
MTSIPPPSYDQITVTTTTTAQTITIPSKLTATPKAAAKQNLDALRITHSNRIHPNNEHQPELVVAHLHHPTIPAGAKHRTQASYRHSVRIFKGKMTVVYIYLIPSLFFSIVNLIQIVTGQGRRHGWTAVLAPVHLVLLVLWCSSICLLGGFAQQ